MTSPETPVGACGDAAPTGDPHYRLAYQTVLLDELIRATQLHLETLDQGAEWQQVHYRHQLEATLQFCKDNR